MLGELLICCHTYINYRESVPDKVYKAHKVSDGDHSYWNHNNNRIQVPSILCARSVVCIVLAIAKNFCAIAMSIIVQVTTIIGTGPRTIAAKTRDRSHSITLALSFLSFGIAWPLDHISYHLQQRVSRISSRPFFAFSYIVTWQLDRFFWPLIAEGVVSHAVS